MINAYLQQSTELSDETIHLLFSANRWERKYATLYRIKTCFTETRALSAALEQKLLAGTSLVCDRYAYSGVAFSAAKGLGMRWCMAPDEGLVAPDCVIFLDLPVADAAQRGDFGMERYEKREMQEKVRQGFTRLMEGDRVPWHVLDATKSIAELHEEIRDIASKTIERVCHEPISRLWRHELRSGAT
jgi:dTMP kinase